MAQGYQETEVRSCDDNIVRGVGPLPKRVVQHLPESNARVNPEQKVGILGCARFGPIFADAAFKLLFAGALRF